MHDNIKISGFDYDVPWDLCLINDGMHINIDLRPIFWHSEEDRIIFSECYWSDIINTISFKYIGRAVKNSKHFLLDIEYDLITSFKKLRENNLVYKDYLSHKWTLLKYSSVSKFAIP